MKNLAKNLEKNIDSVYHIVGDDILLMEEAINILESACENQMGDINKAVFNDENFNAEKVILSCEQMPMMAKKRLVIVKYLPDIKKAELQKIVNYAENSSSETMLVLCEMPTLNIFKDVKATKVQCKKLNESELKNFIVSEFKKYNKEISQEAQSLLIMFCKSDLLRIKNEVFKLAFCKNMEVVDVQDVKKLVFYSEDYSVFELSTALINAQSDKAINLLYKMLETMEFPVILGLISANFRRMLYASISEGSSAEIAGFLKVKDFAITKAKSMASKLKPIMLIKINQIILDIDYSIKSGKMAVENAMYYLVFAIIAILKGEKID